MVRTMVLQHNLIVIGMLLCLVAYTNAALPPVAKCSACKAIAFELDRAIRKEMPSMNIDLRSRLTPSGERVGKVVDYHMSELRALEVTEDLCKNMEDYAKTDNDGTPVFVKVKNTDGVPITITGSLQLGGQHDSGLKDLTLFCDALVEEYEEEITQLIQTAEPGESIADVETSLCQSISRQCNDNLLRQLTEATTKDDSDGKGGDSESDTAGNSKKKKGKKKKKRKSKKKKRRKKKKKGGKEGNNAKKSGGGDKSSSRLGGDVGATQGEL